jgi:SHS2 domain-containing protein
VPAKRVAEHRLDRVRGRSSTSFATVLLVGYAHSSALAERLRVVAVGHRQIEHTADLALEIWGPDEISVLCEAARAVVAIVTEHAKVQPTDERRIELETLDGADRLVRWLNEVLFLATVEKFLVCDADLLLGEGSLTATLVGQADAGHLLRTEIKSATYHDLMLEHRDGGVLARVVMDV